MSRDEDELLGIGLGDELLLVDNGAFTEIEDLNQGVPVETDETPYLPGAVDGDGVPGDRPYVDANDVFQNQTFGDGEFSPEPADQTSDDVEDRLKQEEAASVDIHGMPVSDLDRHINRDNIKHEEIRHIAPYVRTNPPTAYRGLLGGQAVCQPGQDPQQVVRWEGEDIESMPVSVAWSPIDSIQNISVADVVLPFVRIQFGTRDGLMSVDVDVGRGGQLSIPASVVYVYLGLYTGSTLPFRLTATVGYLPIVRTSTLTFTDYPGGFTNGVPNGIGVGVPGAAISFRPSFASSVMFERSNYADPYTLAFYGSTSIPLYEHVIAANTYLTNPIPIANDIQKMLIVNNGAAGAQCRVIWGLNL